LTFETITFVNETRKFAKKTRKFAKKTRKFAEKRELSRFIHECPRINLFGGVRYIRFIHGT